MTENLLEATLDAGDAGAGADSRAPQPASPAKPPRTRRPAQLPEKFWDAAAGEVRLDALLKSYLELERAVGAGTARTYPDDADGYQLQITHELLSADPEINRRLHRAGFSQEQVQLVYDLAAERLMPMVAEIAALFEAEKQIDLLEKHFGGEERWREVARQLKFWGQKHLPTRVFDALAMTSEGVIVMHRMMTGSEPGILRKGDGVDATLSDKQLKQLMRDTRYWRDQDPIMVERVREGFRQLYNEDRD